MKSIISIILVVGAASQVDAASKKQEVRALEAKLDRYLSQVKPFELNALTEQNKNDKLQIQLIKKPKGK